MSTSTIVAWVREVALDGDGLFLKLVRLSTFVTTEYHLTSVEREVIKAALNKIDHNYIQLDVLRNSIFEWSATKLPVPLAYIGNMATDIIPDVSEPEDFKITLGNAHGTRLFGGDYMFLTKHNKLVAIERKQLQNGELVGVLTKKHGSVESRLVSQVKKMDAIADIKILLIETGYFKVNRWTRRLELPMAHRVNKQGIPSTVQPYRWIDIQKQLMSFMDRWGLFVVYSYNKDHVVDDIVDLRNYLNKPEHASQRVAVHATVVESAETYDRPVQMLCFAAGIGPKLAERAMKHFGSLRIAVNADSLEWQKIDGIGKKKADAIQQAFLKELE